MKSWKKALKSQLNKVVPPLDDNIKKLPIDTPTNKQTASNEGNTLVRSKKAIISIISVVLILTIVVIALACTLSPKKSNDSMIFTVEINPSVTLMTDKNGIVTNVISSNPDADVILSNSDILSKILGKPLDAAVVVYTDCASMLGYLDVTKKGSAVRISACEKGEELLSAAQNSLQSYLIDKGVFAVVVGETVKLSEFTVRSGISVDSFDGLISTIKTSHVLYNDRTAQNSDFQKLMALYKEYVLSPAIVPVVKDYILDNIALIEQLEAFYPIISAEQIKAILDDFSTELLVQYAALFADVLQIIGKDSEITNIMQTPKNVQEFLDKLSAVLNIEFTQRKNAFENIYNEEREITKVQYDSYINEIINQYGSLNDYWNAIK